MDEEYDINDINNIHITNNLIDIRDKYEYMLGHINGSINIPMNYLYMNPENYLEKETTYYLYCDYGMKSRKLSSFLNDLGYKTISLIGGYEKYIEKPSFK